MSSNEPVSFGQMSPAMSAVLRAARLLSFGFIGWLVCFSADDSGGKVIALVAVLAIAAQRGITWYVVCARAERRRRAAFGRYAEQETAGSKAVLQRREPS